MMIPSIHIQNYRCLRDVRLRLGPLTALVGPNASGKSAVLRALDFDSSPRVEDAWRGEASVEILVRQNDGGVPGVRQWTPAKDRVRVLHAQPLRAVYRRHHFDLAQMRTPVQLAAESTLSANGHNLANVFYSLSRKEQAALSADLCELVNVYSDVETRPRGSGAHTLFFQDRWCPTLWSQPDDVSDGTLFLLALLTLTRQQPPVDVIAIEEPERGLHPYLLRQVVERLRGLAEGHIGPRPVQIILATHSAEVLNLLRLEEVRFFRRSPEDGSTIVEMCPTTSPEWERAFAEYGNSLSEAWLSGALGGVPGAAP